MAKGQKTQGEAITREFCSRCGKKSRIVLRQWGPSHKYFQLCMRCYKKIHVTGSQEQYMEFLKTQAVGYV